MTDAEQKLAALWEADAPPARDAAFRLAVHARQARQRTRNRFALLGAVGLGATIAAALMAPDATALVSGNEPWVAIISTVPALAFAALAVARGWERRVRR